MYFVTRTLPFILAALFSVDSIAQNIVSNPTGSQTITQPTGTTFTVQGATNLQNLASLNNVLWVDGVKFKTLAVCYGALPTTGGTCMVPPNYTETLTSQLTMNIPGAGFRFTGPAQVTLASSAACGIDVRAGTNGAFIVSDTPYYLTPNSTALIYTGSGSALCVGDNASSSGTNTFVMRNIRVDISGGGTSSNKAVGVDLAHTAGCEVDGVNVIGNSQANTTQIGFVLNGTSARGFAGTCTFINTNEGAVNIGIQFTGTGTEAGNASTIINNVIFGLSGANSTCLDFQAGSSANLVIGGDCEGVTTALHFEGNSSDNQVWLRDETIAGNDVTFESGTAGNIVHMLVDSTKVSDMGTNNSVVSPRSWQENSYLWQQFANSYWGVANNVSGRSRLYMNTSNTFISAEGSGGVVFNGNSGTSGVLFYNGANTQVASIDGNGNAQFNTLSVSGAKSFRIDDPLDPERKYLYHASVESPDMKNIYDGVVTLGAKGTAVVKLPAYFEALNKDFRYQLTSIGNSAPVYVAREIKNNRFVIAGGRPGLKVSWQVTGIRHDAYANAHRMLVEQEKPAEVKISFPPEQPATTSLSTASLH